MQRKTLWEIEYDDGLIIQEDIKSQVGDGGWSQAIQKNNIKYLYLLTPNGKINVDLHNGYISNNSVFDFEKQIELSNKNVKYKPLQRKWCINDNGKNNLIGHQIGWEADFGEFKKRAIINVDVNSFQITPFLEEVV